MTVTQCWSRVDREGVRVHRRIVVDDRGMVTLTREEAAAILRAAGYTITEETR